MFPQDREENALHAIRQDLRLQSSEKESSDTTLLDNVSHHLKVRQLFRIALFVDLDDTDGVAACVADCRRPFEQTKLSDGLCRFLWDKVASWICEAMASARFEMAGGFDSWTGLKAPELQSWMTGLDHESRRTEH